MMKIVIVGIPLTMSHPNLELCVQVDVEVHAAEYVDEKLVDVGVTFLRDRSPWLPVYPHVAQVHYLGLLRGLPEPSSWLPGIVENNLRVLNDFHTDLPIPLEFSFHQMN